MNTLSILAAFDFRDPIWQFWVGVGSLVLSAVAIVITVILAVRGRQRKLLTYEILSDTAIVNSSKDLGHDVVLLLDGHPANNIRLVYVQLANAGNTAIDVNDFSKPLYLNFGEHNVIRYAIHSTDPENLFTPADLKEFLQQDGPNQLLVQKMSLNPKNAVYLKVLCRIPQPQLTQKLPDNASLPRKKDREVQVQAIGQIKDGIIKKFIPTPPRITGRRVVVGVLIAFVLGLLIPNSIGLVSAFSQGACSLGSIQVGGSTAFYDTAKKEAQKYHAACPVSSISVNESSSASGLSDVENNSQQIANSELISPYKDLQDHPVAIIVFALIINKSVHGVNGLTSAQIQQIYGGVYKFWDEVNPAAGHIPIKVIARPSTSGTHAAFVRYILHQNEPSLPAGASIVDRTEQVVSMVASTDGAIGYVDLGAADKSVSIVSIDQYAPTQGLVENNTYQFWAVEHMYTKQNADALSLSFIDYVKRDIQTNNTFIRLSDMLDQTALASHE